MPSLFTLQGVTKLPVATSPVMQLQSSDSSTIRKPCSVAVIGSGAAGLVAARELQREGHRVVVYEQNSEGVGGVWRYSPQIEEDDLLGVSPNRKSVHTSMYLSLRTNLPREIMGYLDFPFVPKEDDPSRDPRRYPGHEEVLRYLEDFAVHFNLLPSILLGRSVTHIGIKGIVIEDGTSYHTISVDGLDIAGLRALLQSHSGMDATRKLHHIQWSVTSKAVGDESDVVTEDFDAVVVCNGHYFQPRIAEIPGIEKWPGKQMHSHNYRKPDLFADQVVVVIGNSSSGMDISREVASVAKEVHWVARNWESSIDMKKPVGPFGNVYLHPMVKSAHEDGSLRFEDGVSIVADIILYCTGYGFSLPCLKLEGIVNVDEDCVWPLYQHVFPPLLAPFISFVGLPYKVVPFPLMELQTKWIAMILSGKVVLPSREEMSKGLEEFYKGIEAKGLPRIKIHDLSSYQFEYDDWLANQCNYPSLESWRHQIYIESSIRKRKIPDTYRDEWTDQNWHEIAIADLYKLGRSINYI